MACEECAAARLYPGHRRFDLKCLWCGARYMQALKEWPPKRMLPNKAGSGTHEETTAERQQWRAHVLKSWADFGHDAQLLKELASAKEVPLEPEGNGVSREEIPQRQDHRGRHHIRQPA